jgi:prevent-host-death family protein
VIDQIGRSGDLSVMKRARRLFVRETVGLYEAKTHLSELVERAAEGEEIVISKSGKPKARLVPLDDVRPLREPGHGRGEWKVGNDFDDLLPENVLDEFEGGGS